jgi:hypothetical protein
MELVITDTAKEDIKFFLKVAKHRWLRKSKSYLFQYKHHHLQA